MIVHKTMDTAAKRGEVAPWDVAVCGARPRFVPTGVVRHRGESRQQYDQTDDYEHTRDDSEVTCPTCKAAKSER